MKLVFPNIKNDQMYEASSEEADAEALGVTWLTMVLRLQFSGSSEMTEKSSKNRHLTCINQQGVYSNFWSSSPIFSFLYYSPPFKLHIYRFTFLNSTRRSKPGEPHKETPV